MKQPSRSHTPYSMRRRAFLSRIGASSACAGLGGWLALAEGQAQTGTTPKRLLLMTRPNGTIRSEWLPQGGPTDFTLPSITAPFEPFRDQLLVLDGLDFKLSGVGSPTHEAGMVTLLTGGPTGDVRPAPNDYRNLLPSVDQHLASQSPHLSSHKSLYLVADARVDNATPQVANRAAAYRGADEPIFPELQPTLVYQRLFGGLMPGGATPENQEALARARLEQKSVLDFVTTDLTNLSSIAPAAARPQLEQHAAVIRELERMLDETPLSSACSVPMEPEQVELNQDRTIGVVGRQHLGILRAAFACDLVRHSTFMWTSAASSAVWSDLYPGMAAYNHHGLSHNDLNDATVARSLAAIDQWYAEQTASFVASLAAIQDLDGASVLDNTLIIYTSAVADGTHSPINIPTALFGGKNLGVLPGRFLSFDASSFNDLWLAVAQAFEAPLASLGDPEQSNGVLPGILA